MGNNLYDLAETTLCLTCINTCSKSCDPLKQHVRSFKVCHGSAMASCGLLLTLMARRAETPFGNLSPSGFRSEGVDLAAQQAAVPVAVVQVSLDAPQQMRAVVQVAEHRADVLLCRRVSLLQLLARFGHFMQPRRREIESHLKQDVSTSGNEGAGQDH